MIASSLGCAQAIGRRYVHANSTLLCAINRLLFVCYLCILDRGNCSESAEPSLTSLCPALNTFTLPDKQIKITNSPLPSPSSLGTPSARWAKSCASFLGGKVCLTHLILKWACTSVRRAKPLKTSLAGYQQRVAMHGVHKSMQEACVHMIARAEVCGGLCT